MNKTVYQLAVVIINYRTPQLVIDCLESLLPELSDLEAKIIVVDNASNDNSYTKLESWIASNDKLKQIELLFSVKNTGFSGGNNFGVCYVDAKYYLLLNSDTLLREGSVGLLLRAAAIDKDKQVGLISPRLEWLDETPQESCFRFHSPVSEFISIANTGLITKVLAPFVVPFPTVECDDYYDWTSFACVLIKSDVFKDVGLMDDGYFMYFEDVSFAFFAQKKGWKVLNVPQAHVVHLRGGSSPVKSQAKQKKRLPRYYYESRTRYFYQVYGQFGLLMANIFWTLGYGVSLMRSSISPSFSSNALECQWRDIWINFSKPLKPYIHPDNYDKA